MQKSIVAIVLYAVLGVGCESMTTPASRESMESAGPVEPLGIQVAELQSASSYHDLRLRMGSAVVLGSTCGAANEVSSVCGSSTAPDHSYRWMAPYDGTYTFTTQGSTFDTVIQLSQWGNGVSLGCNNDAGGTAQSSVSVYLPATRAIRITVDGAGAACGDFQLNISGVAASCGPDYCAAPPGACHQPFGTCASGTCTYELKEAGSSCEDGDSCTSGDTCNGFGVCQSGVDTCACFDGRLPCNGECCGPNFYCNGSFCEYSCYPALEGGGENYRICDYPTY